MDVKNKRCSSLLSTLRTTGIGSGELETFVETGYFDRGRSCGKCRKEIECNPEKAVIKLLTIADQALMHLAVSAAGLNSLYRFQSNLDLFFFYSRFACTFEILNSNILCR